MSICIELLMNFQAILEQNHFSLTRTADQLRISRHALRYRMQRLNISAGIDEDTSFQTRDSIRS